ncbi:MAG: chitobiase/beta-hexosaminidase C-terminal domain-containing protein, partial [Candidatus Cloacimonadaceae bacterium]|nr:chitobiase/beta-hexosaminidase C-terminal domain-containing protein [Candidatus Cloacimonadaceae bacterium]
MRRTIYQARFMLPVLMLLVFGICGLNAQFAGGNGTLANPYRIQSPEHLNNVRNYTTSHFVQIADIDLQQYLSAGGAGYNGGQAWEPIGTETPDMSLRFIGTYDGNGYLISNLTINRAGQHYIGLFGFLGVGGGVRNLGLTNVNISGGMQVGGLVGGTDQTWITNCFVQGSVNATAIAGLLAGSIANGSNVQRCFSTGNVSATGNTIGGLMGALSTWSNLNASYSEADVTSAGEAIGGLVGLNWVNTIMTDCYSVGMVQSPGDDVGGLTGKQLYDAVAHFCYWDMESSGLVYSASGEGRSTAQMQQQNNYVGWNFNSLWAINQGSSYPFYQWQALQMPVFDPEPGVYATPIDVFLSHSVVRADIYYRMAQDQDTWSEWFIYDGFGIELPAGHTFSFEAYADRAGYHTSATAEATYNIQAVLAMPMADPASGVYTGSVSVVLSSSDSDVQIHYTTDGSEPTDLSPLYQEPLTFVSDTLLRAKSYKDGWIPSPVLSMEYTIEPVSVGENVPDHSTTKLFSAY